MTDVFQTFCIVQSTKSRVRTGPCYPGRTRATGQLTVANAGLHEAAASRSHERVPFPVVEKIECLFLWLWFIFLR